MKTLKTLLFYSVLVLFQFGNTQDLQKGFDYLNNGSYANAERFFESILKDYPNNRTARLCYGRAIGLNGKPNEALKVFQNLKSDYPDDYEIQLNLAEGLLWNNEYKEAQLLYEVLISTNPESFPALLGYANTLSNLKQYSEARHYVNKALVVSPNNPNAMQSKKYINLGDAYQSQQKQEYLNAEAILKANLNTFKADKETLLNLANLYIIMSELEQAESTYRILADSTNHKIEAKVGLALVAHLNGFNKKALDISKEAYQAINEISNPVLTKQTTERYIQALIWNRKFNEAERMINELAIDQPNDNWILALDATLNIYKSKFDRSLESYNKILLNDSTSFDGNLGKANTLKAIGEIDKAYEAAEKTLTFYNQQKDALNFIKTLDLSFTPSITTKASYTFDNGDNNAYSINTMVTIPMSTKLSLNGNLGFRRTRNAITDSEANSKVATIGGSYKLGNNLKVNSSIGLTTTQAQQNNYTQFLIKTDIELKPFALQQINLGYNRDIQNFNTELLEQEIVQNNYFITHNLSSNVNLGWYTQYIFTNQSDGNSRHLLFTSLYYNLFQKPALKAGLNYQYITFEEQVPNIYFSPETFNAAEVFINMIKDEITSKPKTWFYELTAATGVQFIEDQDHQSTYRFQGSLGYKFSDRAMLNLYATHSNIASATAAGFTFTEIGVRFKWLFTKTPLFK